MRGLSDELRQLFLTYEWPGNIRELENMLKRMVVLQDEQLVIREIRRNLEKSAAAQLAASMVADGRRRRDPGDGGQWPRRPWFAVPGMRMARHPAGGDAAGHDVAHWGRYAVPAVTTSGRTRG